MENHIREEFMKINGADWDSYPEVLKSYFIDGYKSRDTEIKKLRDEKIELKDVYRDVFETYIPADKLGEANEYCLSLFKDYKMSKAMVDRKNP